VGAARLSTRDAVGAVRDIKVLGVDVRVVLTGFWCGPSFPEVEKPVKW
jgi:dihydrodipicolinate synthase/N-acetylneuraminate lyase